ncbi:MAG: hypothetical protein ACOY93_08595 [Bacillota bacterium]
MRQLTLDDLANGGATAGYPAGRWVLFGGTLGLVGLTTGQRSPDDPDRSLVVAGSLAGQAWGWSRYALPVVVYLRPEEMVEIDPQRLPAVLVTALREAASRETAC